MNGTQDSPTPLAGAEATPDRGTDHAPPARPPQPQVQAQQDPRTKSPALACFLSAMPGLGQVYTGYYQRGFVHAVVVGLLISLLASFRGDQPLIPLFALFLAFFWLYNIIDAGRRAVLYNQVLAGREDIAPPRDFKMPGFGGSIFGGLILIGLGLILLLHTKWDVSLEWVGEWWPLAPILLGVYLLVKAVQERSAKASSPESG